MKTLLFHYWGGQGRNHGCQSDFLTGSKHFKRRILFLKASQTVFFSFSTIDDISAVVLSIFCPVHLALSLPPSQAPGKFYFIFVFSKFIDIINKSYYIVFFCIDYEFFFGYFLLPGEGTAVLGARCPRICRVSSPPLRNCCRPDLGRQTTPDLSASSPPSPTPA